MREHWLIASGLARRTAAGPIDFFTGMSARWTGSNWAFTRRGAVVLFVVAFVVGVTIGVVGRTFVVHA